MLLLSQISSLTSVSSTTSFQNCRKTAAVNSTLKPTLLTQLELLVQKQLLFVNGLLFWLFVVISLALSDIIGLKEASIETLIFYWLIMTSDLSRFSNQDNIHVTD